MKCWNIKVSNFKIMRSIGIALLVLVFTGAADGFLYGQAGRGRGRLKGIITNKDGQYIENARIQIVWHKNQEFKRETVTNKKGRFTFNGLSGGNWQIFVIADGYAQVQKMASIKQVADNPTVKITLKKQMAAVKQEIMKDDGSSILDKGKQLFAQAKYEEAQEAFEKFLQKQPNVYQTYLLLGNCYKEKAEYKEARAQYDKALENAPKDGSDTEFTAQVQAGIGDIYMRQNDLKTAQEYFQKSLDLNPKDHILAYNVGEIFFSNNKTEEAIRYFNQAATIKPDWGQPHLKIGYAYLNSADYKNAIAAFKKFLELDPQSKEAPAIKDVIKSLKDL